MDLEIPHEPEFEMGGGGLDGTGGDDLRCRPETIDLIIRNNVGDGRVTLPSTLSNDAEFFPACRRRGARA